MTSLFSTVWPFLAAGGVALCSIFFAFVKSKSADSKVAQAGQKVAEAQTTAARAQTQTAEVRDAEAQANATASAAGEQASKERTNVEAETAGMSDTAVRDSLFNDWARPRESVGRGAASGGSDPGR